MSTTPEDQVELRNVYQVDKRFVRIRVTKDRKNKNMKNAAGEKSLFVLDKSGSMYQDWAQVQRAVVYMTQEAGLEPDFIVYDDTAKRVTVGDVLTSSAGGSTNFEAAFKAIQKYINELPINTQTTVVFMTDGHNNGGDLAQGLQCLKIYLAACRRPSCIHTIGFSSSHDRSVLDKIRVLGTSEGVYRYAEQQNLDEKFEEIFDFICVTSKSSIQIGNGEVKQIDSTKTEEGFEIDVIFKLSEIDPKNEIFTGKPCTIKLDGSTIELQPVETDLFFTCRTVEEMEIVTKEDLEKAEGYLKGVNISKVPKEKRRQLLELKLVVQQKLDKFHALFAEIARGLVSGENISAQLSSLRHETKFSKARRARAMDKRIANNIDEILAIEDELEALPAPNLSLFEKLDLTCNLSNATIYEVMKDTKNDFFVFPLRIARPEQAIDAPTQIIIEKFLVGNYSFEAFKDSLKFAINNVGSQKALGGFTSPLHKNDEAVGLFRGCDGELTNACLPLYINEEHWKRVEIQLKPILGYFFTMDPLGYKGDQMIALYMILGHMICLQSKGELNSEFNTWIINDFTKTCTAILPHILKYLKEGRYGGFVRGDLLEEFVSAPKFRTKENLSSLLNIVGWNACTSFRDSCKLKFDFAFVEEVWRRNFTSLFKGQSRNQIDDWLENLLFIEDYEKEQAKSDTNAESDTQTQTSEEDTPTSDDDNIPISGNTFKNENKLFSEYAKAKFGQLSKKKGPEVLKKYPNGPSSSGVTETTYSPRCLSKYDDHSEKIDILVSKILESIRSKNEFLMHVFDKCVSGEGFSGKAKWLMLIQALKYSTNSLMNQAVNNGNYLNTFDYCSSEDPEKDETAFLQEIYNQFEYHRKNEWTSIIAKKESFLQAKKLALCTDLFSFCGRLLTFCPIRGGEVFSNLISLLIGSKVNDKPIPLLSEKISIILTGKVSFNEGGEKFDAIANGTSWVHCPANTAMLLRDVVSESNWINIENSMHGTYGWTYRPSDIPNRHGHCNSNPNRALVTSFTGFALGNAPKSQ